MSLQHMPRPAKFLVTGLALGLVSVLLTTTLFTKAAIGAFTAAVTLSGSGTALSPSIAGNNQALHAVWAEEVSAGNREVLYARSTDNGVTFPTNQRKQLSSSLTFGSTSPSVAIGGNTGSFVHVIWEENGVDGNADIFYTRSTDRGVTFAAPVNLSNDIATSTSPKIKTGTASRVYITWVSQGDDNSRVRYTRSIDDGATFVAAADLTDGTYNIEKLAMTVNGGNPIIAWTAQGPTYGTYRILSTDNGVTYNTPVNIAGNNATPTYNPTLAIDGSGVAHAAWSTLTEGGTQDIFYARSANGGSTFSASLNLSNSLNAQSDYPIIRTIGNSTVNVLWSETVCNGDCAKHIFVSDSANSGNSFASPVATDTLSSSVEESEFETVGNTLYVIFQEFNVIKFKKGTKN